MKESKKYGPRADLGKPIDSFFKKQTPEMRVILEALRELVEKTVPDAKASIKWGMPFYALDDQMMCALAGFKSHVNIIFAGPPESFKDPKGLLEGEGKMGRHLKLRSLDELPRASVQAWLRTAAKNVRKK
jgi:hypothetical protein